MELILLLGSRSRMVRISARHAEEGGSIPPETTRYIMDSNKHLVCYLYSITNLHKMAEDLGIKRCWFHSGKNAHYDIPKRRLKDISKKCLIVSSKTIIHVIRGQKPSEYFCD